MCDGIELELVPLVGYRARCRCGYRCEFGVAEVVGAQHFSGIVCNEMRASVLATFGPGGSRTLAEKGDPGFLPMTLGTREEPFSPGRGY